MVVCGNVNDEVACLWSLLISFHILNLCCLECRRLLGHYFATGMYYQHTGTYYRPLLFVRSVDDGLVDFLFIPTGLG